MLRMILITIGFVIVEQITISYLARKKKSIIEKNFKLEIENKYIKERVLYNLLWYEENAYIYRLRFIVYSMINIVLSSSIPLITLWGNKVFDLDNNVIIASFSTIISIISGYLYLRQPKDRWYDYRKNAESLKGIISLKIINNLSEAELLKQVEIFFNKENENWYSQKEKKKKGKSKNKRIRGKK